MKYNSNYHPKTISNYVWVFLFCCFFTTFTTTAQKDTYEYEDYTWEDDRKRIEIPSHLQEETSLVLVDKNIVEYFYDRSSEEITVYKTYHVIRWLNSTDAVERYNKLYIPLGEGELTHLEVRAISPEGKITISNQSNLKEVKDEETGRAFKMLAIEGVEKGSEIEFLYTTKEPFQSYHQEGRYFLQSSTHTQNVLFELITPSHLDFESKSYNGLVDAEFIEDEEKEKRIRRIQLDSVSALKGEPFSAVEAEKMRVDYKFAYNLATNPRNRIRTWTVAANQIYNVYCVVADKKEEKAVKKLYKEVGITSADGTEERIRKIENFIKVKIQGEESQAPQYILLNEIEKSRIASERGLVRLFAQLLQAAEVDFELVLTTDRSEIKFDKDFDMWLNLNEFLIYFPETKKYLAPAGVLYRYGLVPSSWRANEGLFIRGLKIGNISSGLGVVRYIEPLEGDKNFTNIDVKVTFEDDMEKANADLTYSFGGISAVGIQGVMPYLDKEKKSELIKNVLKGIAEDGDFKDAITENDELNVDLLAKPFTIKSKFSTQSWIEKAGNNYLFSIGKTIGAQSELYQENERKLPIENDHNRVYKRKLIFTIPEGYKVKNLDDLKLNVVFDANEKKNCGFVSDYKQDGNTVTVDVFEYYYEIFLPKKDYEEYRKVINAAADFNKIVLVLEKI